jgi:hypothetical protein
MEALAAARPPGYESVEKGHGRLEARRLWQSVETAWFADAPQWKGLRSFALLRGVREFPDGRREESQRLYLSSLGEDPARAAEVARAHWGIENGCHWCLDVLMGEDPCRARTFNAAVNLGAMRKHGLNLLRASPSPPVRRKNISLSGKHYYASQNFEYLVTVICQNPTNENKKI